jgi:hypothetical protein
VDAPFSEHCLIPCSCRFKLIEESAGGRRPVQEAKTVNQPTKWERYAALGGVLFVVLVIVSIAVMGSTPKSSDSASKILKSFQDHKDGIKVGTFIGGLAAIPLLWWAGSLYARMRRAEDGQTRLALIAVLGLVLGGAGQIGMAAIDATVVLTLRSVGANEAKFFFVMGQNFASAALIGLAVLTFAVSVLAFRTRVFPIWVAWIGIVDAIAFVVASYAVATTGDAIGGVGFGAFILWAIWIIVTSVIMFRTTASAEPAPTMATSSV